MPYFVYILQNPTGHYYIGQTQDLAQRLDRHNSNRVPATKGKGPWQLVHTEQFATRADAVRRERDIKSLKSRSYIEQLVRPSRA